MVLGMVISFQITTLEVESMKEVINKLDYINFENICSENDNLHRIRRPATGWERMSTKDTCDKEPLSKVNKELLNVNN